MKIFLLIMICLLLAAQPVMAAEMAVNGNEAKLCRIGSEKIICETGAFGRKSGDNFCQQEKRGRCGKRRGDWYGARQPVANIEEARVLLMNYFAGQDYIVSTILERRWGFRAEILDKDGKVIDRVMIDKRSGRIRSLY